VVAGNVVNRALTFLIQSVLARSMEKPVFAIFNVTAMTLEVATELADLGLNVNLVRNYSRHAEKNRPAALSVVQLVLRIKIVWVLFLTIALYLLAPYFALLLRNPELAGPFRFAAIGLAAPVMVYFALAHLQAVRRFGRYIVVNLVERVGLLALITALAVTGYLGLSSALAAWILFPFLAAVLGLALAPHDYIRIRRIEPGVASEVFHFGKWALVSSLLTLALWRLDVFMMTALSTKENLADYVYAVRLIALFQVVTQGLNTTLLPRVGRFESLAECRVYLKTIWKLAPVVVLGSVLVCLVARPLMVIPFGQKALEAVAIFRVLLVGEALMILAVPMSLLFYRLNRVDLICLMNVIMLVVCAGANWVFVPRFAGMGAAVTYLLVRLSAMICTMVLVLYALRKQIPMGKLAD
jgi:O-antigen/teichoic acid export membrane protein